MKLSGLPLRRMRLGTGRMGRCCPCGRRPLRGGEPLLPDCSRLLFRPQPVVRAASPALPGAPSLPCCPCPSCPRPTAGRAAGRPPAPHIHGAAVGPLRHPSSRSWEAEREPVGRLLWGLSPQPWGLVCRSAPTVRSASRRGSLAVNGGPRDLGRGPACIHVGWGILGLPEA